MTPGRRAIWAALAACWSLGLPAGAATPAHQSQLEYSVKANYLVRFAAFVGWPPRAFANSQAPVVICVAGRDRFNGSLDRAAQAQTAHGRPLVVRRPGTPEAAAGCHILYVGQGGAAMVSTAATKASMLVVTDAAVSGDRGMIHFVVNDARVRFHIDLQAATHSGLSFSSRLLNLALSVRGG